jgi:hypothetical protein
MNLHDKQRRITFRQCWCAKLLPSSRRQTFGRSSCCFPLPAPWTWERDRPPGESQCEIRFQQPDLDSFGLNKPHRSTTRISVKVRIVKLLQPINCSESTTTNNSGDFQYSSKYPSMSWAFQRSNDQAQFSYTILHRLGLLFRPKDAEKSMGTILRIYAKAVGLDNRRTVPVSAGISDQRTERPLRRSCWLLADHRLSSRNSN